VVSSVIEYVGRNEAIILGSTMKRGLGRLRIVIDKGNVIISQGGQDVPVTLSIVIPVDFWSDVNAAVRTMADDLKTL